MCCLRSRWGSWRYAHQEDPEAIAPQILSGAGQGPAPQNKRGSALISFQAHPPNPPAVDFFSIAASWSSSPVRSGISSPPKKSLQSPQTLRMPAEQPLDGLHGGSGYPCLPKVGINERGLNQNPRLVAEVSGFAQEVRGRRDKVRSKPLIWKG